MLIVLLQILGYQDLCLCTKYMYNLSKRYLFLSGRVLDSRPRGRGFEPHRRHCVVALEHDTFILAQYGFNTGNPSLFN